MNKQIANLIQKLKLFADDVIISISVTSLVIVEDRNTVRLGQETEKYCLVKEYNWLLTQVSTT